MTGNLIVALTRAAPPLAQQAARAKALGADLVELRVDQIGDIPVVEAFLRLPAADRSLPCILTVRAREEGGYWDGDDAGRISLIQYLGMLGPEYVDVELATWERSANVRQKVGLVAGRTDGGGEGERAKARLILSYHDLNGTPEDAALIERFRALSAAPCHVAKAVFTCRDATDAIRILAAARVNAGSKPLIALGMGEGGLLTRVLARKFGMFGAYAALDSGAESAAGQPTVEEMASLYRWQSLGPATELYGVIGWPVAHSLSPKLHNAAMAADGRNGVYVPLPVRGADEEFAAFMDEARRAPWLDVRGFSVTIPHKEHALRWLREHHATVTSEAVRCGAVNTLICDPAQAWSGDNTDVWGVMTALAIESTIELDAMDDRVVRILGAGGAARAVCAALRASTRNIVVCARSAGRAAALAAEFDCESAPWEQRSAGPRDIVVNCTPLGMYPNVDETPLPAERLARGAVVFDTVYNPRETRLLREARQRGCEVVGGIEMFRHQAKRQYHLWHGREMPDVSV